MESWGKRRVERGRRRVEMDLLYQGLSGILAHFVDFFAASPGAHCTSVAIVVFLFLEFDIGAVARYYYGAARFSAAETGSWLQRGVGLGAVVLVDVDGRSRRGGRHVVGIRDVVNSGGVGSGCDLWLLRHEGRQEKESSCKVEGRIAGKRRPLNQVDGRQERTVGAGWVVSTMLSCPQPVR